MGLFDNVEFRTFDFDGFKNSLFQLAKGEFPKWTDTLETNQGVVFVEWLGFISASLCYSENFHSRQAFVATVDEDKNLVKLAKQYAYKIPNNVAAVVDAVISKQDATPFLFDTPIKKGTILRTAGTESLIFETTADLLIPAGANNGTIPAKNQETKAETDTSDGGADFKSTMNFSPYVEDSMSVKVDGVGWAKVDNFLDSLSNSTHYRVEVDSSGVATVIFGDGVNGKIPPVNALIEYSYAVGGGSIGNIQPGSLTVIPGVFYDSMSNLVDLVVNNPNKGDGGADRESKEVSKIRLPASIPAKDITINASDFVTNIGSVPGVARVSVRTVNDDANIPENTVICFILPQNSDTLSLGLEQQIETALEADPRPITQSMLLIGPQFVTIPIDIRDLDLDPKHNDGSGVKANATITITNNTFNPGDSVLVNGVAFMQGVQWLAGIDVNASATALKNAINTNGDPRLQDIEAVSSTNVVTVRARTTGIHGNDYTLSKVDGGTSNFTLSNSKFQHGEDSTTQALIRTAVANFFGRTNVDENGEYTVNFGGKVYRNRLIQIVESILGVRDFNLLTPVANTSLNVGEFPKYTLKFTTT